MLDDGELLRRVRELGARLRTGLRKLEGVTEVRGRGLMVGTSLEQGIDATVVARAALEAGLVINVPATGMLRLLPPLVVEETDVDRGIEILSGAPRAAV